MITLAGRGTQLLNCKFRLGLASGVGSQAAPRPTVRPADTPHYHPALCWSDMEILTLDQVMNIGQDKVTAVL